MIRQFLPFTKGLLEIKIRLDSHVRWYLTIGIDWQKLSCGIHSTESVGRICEQEQPYFGPRTWAAQVSNGKPKRQRPIPGFWIPIDHVRSSRHYCWQQLCDEAGTWLDSKDAEIFVQVVVDVFKRKRNLKWDLSAMKNNENIKAQIEKKRKENSIQCGKRIFCHQTFTWNQFWLSCIVLK